MVRILTFSAAVVIIAGGLVWFCSPVKYEAYALLRVARKPPTVLEQAREETDNEFAIYKRTQIQLILSGAVLQSAVRDPDIKRLSVIKQLDDPVAWLKEELILDYPDDAEILRVAIATENKNEAKKIVDAVVQKYLSEVVQAERMQALGHEGRLEERYAALVEEFTRQQEALMGMEQVARVSSSSSGMVEKALAEDALQQAIDTRKFLKRQILENEIEANRLQLKSEASSEARTADTGAAAGDDDVDFGNALQVIQQQHAFLEAKLDEAGNQVRGAEKKLKQLARDTGNVTAKRQEVASLNQITMEVKAMLDRAQVERLARARITKVDDARIVSDHEEIWRRWIGLSVAAAASLGLVVVGLVAGGPSEPRPE